MARPEVKKGNNQNKSTKPTTSTAKKTTARAKPTVSKLTVSDTDQNKKTASTKTAASAKSKPQASKTVKEASIKDSEEKTQLGASQQQSVKLSKPYVIAAVIIIVLGFLVYNYRGLFVAAVVNGQPISRLSVIQETEKESGKQAMATIVRNTLIQQEAQKEGVTVSDAEVNNQLNTVKQNLAKQGESLNAVLAQQGMTMDDLTQLLRLDLLVQKMVGKSVVITNKQISDYIAQNQSTLPQNLSQSALRSTVKQQLQQQELNQKTQTWLQNLQDNAHIIYFVQY